ncbi:hypothetical protein A3I95_03515 [Candidatus Nomurabacteria bacterium RIFCSPLOWO2_02_FULL_44_12]|nr:MAG: hypothetical protein A3I95_03515 [Candidatus Nomurabacteria bacterium RIFCSPLOWO2_02_FULL_44_12]
MNNKAMWWVIVAIIVVVGGIYWYMQSPATENNSSSTTGEENQTTGAQGRVIFSVTDAAADMSAISEINMRISRVDIQSSTSGWVTASTTPRTYDLLALDVSGESKLLADVGAAAGTYNQVRLVVDSITVKTKAGATKTAKLPSGELRINTVLVVNANSVSSVNFDFLADKSLHTTGSGEYIFAPVVKTETRSGASVSVDANSKVSISGGRVDSSNTVGMDIDGTVKLNFQLKSDQKLNLGINNVIELGK